MDPNNPGQSGIQHTVVQDQSTASKRFHLPRVLMVLFVALGAAAISGVIFYMLGQAKGQQNSNSTPTTASNTTITKVSPQPTFALSPTVAQGQTANWINFTSALGKFSLSYPPSWQQPSHRDLCNKDLFNRAVFLGPDSSSVLVCGSGYGGQIIVTSAAGDQRGNAFVGHDVTNIKTQQIIINGVTGTRTTATIGANDMRTTAGTIYIIYEFFTNNNTYEATYIQVPSNQDVSTDFDTMVQKTLKFTQ